MMKHHEAEEFRLPRANVLSETCGDGRSTRCSSCSRCYDCLQPGDPRGSLLRKSEVLAASQLVSKWLSRALAGCCDKLLSQIGGGVNERSNDPKKVSRDTVRLVRMLVKEDESEHVMARVRNESRRGKRVRRLLEVARHSNLFVMMAPIIARTTWKMSSSAEVEHDRALRTCVAATASAVAVVEEDNDGSLLPAVAEATIDALSELLYEETRQNRSLASEEGRHIPQWNQKSSPMSFPLWKENGGRGKSRGDALHGIEY